MSNVYIYLCLICKSQKVIYKVTHSEGEMNLRTDIHERGGLWTPHLQVRYWSHEQGCQKTAWSVQPTVETKLSLWGKIFMHNFETGFELNV